MLSDSVAALKKDLALKAAAAAVAASSAASVAHQQHLDAAAEDSSEDSSQDARRKKKARTTFTGRQIFELEKQFEVKKYLSSSERAEMAKLLNVTETQVCTCFILCSPPPLLDMYVYKRVLYIIIMS